MGFLNQEGEFHTLSLTPKALEALRNRAKIMGQVQEVQERASKKANIDELEYNHALFAILRAKRKELADEAGVPPYVIFSDRTLVEMAAYSPQTAKSLLDISGVGQVKARQYGETFLDLIREYSQKHNIPEKQRPTAPKRESKSEAGQRSSQVGQAYNAGESIRSLMARYGVTAGTILDHLVKYSAAGNTLRKDDELQTMISISAMMQKTVFEAFAELGTEYLKPVFDRLNGTVSYDDLKILRLAYLSAKQ
jgi:ATP-dependent DNA helicase RecQ